MEKERFSPSSTSCEAGGDPGLKHFRPQHYHYSRHRASEGNRHALFQPGAGDEAGEWSGADTADDTAAVMDLSAKIGKSDSG